MTDSLPILRHPGAPDWLDHGFTTRAMGDMLDPRRVAALSRALGGTKVGMLRQVHGIRLLDPADAGTGPVAADGWVGNLFPGETVAIRTADCLAVLLYGEAPPAVALVHAGWRGAVGGIVEAAVARLERDPATLTAVLGPAIGPCCFEVGQEVAAAARRPGEAQEAHFRPTGPGKFHFDLRGWVRARLEARGLSPGRIHLVGGCTKCEEGYYSHRGGDTARMAAFARLG